MPRIRYHDIGIEFSYEFVVRFRPSADHGSVSQFRPKKRIPGNAGVDACHKISCLEGTNYLKGIGGQDYQSLDRQSDFYGPPSGIFYADQSPYAVLITHCLTRNNQTEENYNSL